MAQQYIRPEKDLLDFTNEDIVAIEEYYNKAYALLDESSSNLNQKDNEEDYSEEKQNESEL